ncbi:MAG: winged helix-turn-helix domain-containing protein [Akkermansia sp.]|nr:winged helix-turn-helix domain-containing protein [Akkermansia sp.]
MSSKSRIIRYMQQHQRATRPQIATALGLSQVSTNAAVAALEAEGKLRRGDAVPSGGGRPVREYLFNARHASVALFTASPEAHCTRISLELLDLQGRHLEAAEARFAQVHEESLDDWLDTASRHHTLQRICLPPALGCGILRHLQQRYHCEVRESPAAEALVNGRQETLTLLLLRGQAPQGAILRHGKVTPCPLLHLLPLPADWETLNYADHTLVEEMLAKLLQLLTCTLAPAHIDLHADFWNDRLISRLNFNLSTKLRGLDSKPQLHFATISPETLATRQRRSAVAC